jgi:LmbE family N-acetylglucosaminyl deacetylase
MILESELPVGAVLRDDYEAAMLDRICESEFETAPSTLVIAAHPDDEVIGAGVLLAKLRHAARILHVTDGSPRALDDAYAAGCNTREEYAELRKTEFNEALEIVGIPESHCWSLRLTDQETTRNLIPLTEMLLGIIAEVQPALILTHSYEGGHPDHDALAFSVHAACALMFERPVLAEFTSYHNSVAGIRSGHFLSNITYERAIHLSDEHRDLKRRLYRAYRSQSSTLQYFEHECERFRIAPVYDFCEPPHLGQLFYEQFSWGVTGHEWRSFARTALEYLGLLNL